MGSGFIIFMIYARSLGPEGFGVISIALATLAVVISFADLGIRQAITYKIGKKIIQVEDSGKIIITLMTFSVPAAILICIGYYLLVYDNADPFVLLLVCLIIPVAIFNTYTKGVSLSTEMISAFNKVDLYQKTIYLLLVIILYVFWTSDDPIYGLISYLGGVLVAFIVSYQVLNKHNAFHFKFDIKPVISLIKIGLVYAITLTIINFNYKSGIYVIEALGSKEEVGIYSVGARIAELMWQVSSSVGLVLFMKSATSGSEKEAIMRTAKSLRLVLPLVLAGCIILFLVSGILIPLLFGIEYTGSVMVTNMLIPGIFFAVIFKVLYPDIAGRGYPEVGLIFFLMLLIVNLISISIAYKYYQIIGVAITTSVIYACGGIAFLFYYTRLYPVTIRELIIPTKEDANDLKKYASSFFKK